MSEPFIGEIRMVAFNYPPRGYIQCDGALLPISQNQALYSLLGNTYGGDGRTTFGVPDLRGRSPIHWGTGPFGPVPLGQSAGEVNHTLTTGEMPGHNHLVIGATAPAADQRSGAGNYLGQAGTNWYNATGPNTTLDPATVTQAGGSQPHANQQPYLVVNFVMALVGIFPSRN